MNNNFPINEDLAYEKIRDLMFDMMEEEPERFHALIDRLNELAVLPKRTMTLVLGNYPPPCQWRIFLNPCGYGSR